MLTIDVLYNPETRRLTLPPGSDLYGGATIDSASVSIRVTGLNTTGASEDLSVRLDFQLPLLTEAHEYVNPFLEMEKTGTSEAGEIWECVLPTDILAATAVHNKLPFQLVIRYGDVVINSRNIISLKTTTAIDALGPIEEFYRPYVMFRNDSWLWLENFTYKKGAVVTYNGNFYISKTDDNLGHNPEETLGEYWILPVVIPDSTIVGVEYDDENAELTFTRQDGGTISISFPDLKYDLFRVATEADLQNIEDALNGDMAVTDAGVWYVYYDDGSNHPVWNQMSSPTTINGSQTTSPEFYAPLVSGNARQMLISQGPNNAPIWRIVGRSFYANFAGRNTYNIPLYNGNTRFVDTDGCNISCEFFDRSTMEKLDLPYQIVTDVAEGDPKYSITVTCNIPTQVRMDVIATPSLGGVF